MDLEIDNGKNGTIFGTFKILNKRLLTFDTRHRKLSLVLILTIFLTIPSLAQVRVEKFMEKGRIEIQQGKYHQAVQTFSRVILQQSDNYTAWYFRGLCKYYLEDKNGAARDITRAIDLNPAVSNCYLLRGIIRDMQGDFYKALEDFTAGLAIAPNNSSLYYSRGTTRLRLNNFSRAIEDFNEAIRIDKRLDEAYVNRGLAKAQLLDREGAFSDFEMAIKLNPFSPEGHSKKGVLLYETKKFDEALLAFKEAIKRDSTNPQYYYIRALSLYEMGQKELCIKDLNKVLKLDPNHSQSWYNRAVIRSQMENYEGAIADYEKVNELHPYHVLSYYNRGLLRNESGDPYGAIFDLDQAILIFPDFVKAYLARASIKRQLGDDLGAQTDRLLAQEKTQANVGNTEEDLALNYADTTIRFEQLITLNSRFNASFNKRHEEELSLGELMGPERVNLKPELKLVELSGRDFALKLNTDPLLDDIKMDTLIGVAMIYGTDSLYNKGIQILNEVLWESPKNMGALFTRAELRFEMIEFIRSTSMMNDLVPMQIFGDPVKVPSQATNQIDYSQIIADYNGIIQIKPDLAVVWLNRGLVKVYARDFNGAVNDFRKAVEIVPGYAVAWYNLGITLIKTGHKDEGCECLSNAGELGLKRAYQSISLHCSQD